MKNILIDYNDTEPIDNPTTEIISQRLEEVEKHLGKKLPESYKIFLLEYNGGGRPGLYNFKRNHDLSEGKNVHGDDFRYGCLWFSYIWSSRDILETKLLNHPALENLDLFSFAYDIGDNPACISLAEKTYGKIYSWEEEQAPDEDDEDCEYYDNIYYLCNSFEDFINRLNNSEEI